MQPLLKHSQHAWHTGVVQAPIDKYGPYMTESDHRFQEAKRYLSFACCMQAALAVVASASSAWLAYKGGPSRSMHVTTALLMGAMLPWTLLVIMPTNEILLSKNELSDTEVTISFVTDAA